MSALEDARAALAEDRDYVVSNRERLLEEILEALIAELERLTTPPTDDEREALVNALLGSRFFDSHDWAGTGSWPGWEYIQWELGELADDILASEVWRFRRQGPITDAQVEAAIRELEVEIPDAYVESASIGPTIVLTKKSAETALAALRRQGSITDAQLLAALNAYDPRFATEDLDNYAAEHQADMRAAVEAAINYKKEQS